MDDTRKNPATETLGQRLSRLRTEFGLTQPQVQNEVHVSVGQISRWENGHERPNTTHLRLLARLYQVSVRYLTTGSLDADNRVQEDTATIYNEVSEPEPEPGAHAANRRKRRHAKRNVLEEDLEYIYDNKELVSAILEFDDIEQMENARELARKYASWYGDSVSDVLKGRCSLEVNVYIVQGISFAQQVSQFTARMKTIPGVRNVKAG